MNQVVLMGRMTRTPELRRTQGGTAVATFTLAVDRGYSSGADERKTDFINCVAWRKAADFVSRYFVKGQMTAVIGRLQIRSWEDETGVQRKSAEVVTDHIYFTGDKRQADSREPDPDDLYFSQIPPSAFEELADEHSELPF